MPKREKKDVKHVSKKRYGNNPKRDNISSSNSGNGNGSTNDSTSESVAEDGLLDGRHAYRGSDKDCS